MSFTTNLNDRIEERSLSALALCAEMEKRGAKVSLSSVKNWIDGVATPRLEHLYALADALGCTPNDLMGFSDPTAKAVG